MQQRASDVDKKTLIDMEQSPPIVHDDKGHVKRRQSNHDASNHTSCAAEVKSTTSDGCAASPHGGHVDEARRAEG